MVRAMHTNLVAAYQNGATIRQVAAQHKVDRGTVMRALATEGVTARRFAWDEASIQVVLDMRRDGLSLGVIADRLGTDHHMLSRNLRHLGHDGQTKHRQSASDEQLAEAVRLYQTGLSIAAIGAKTGLSRGGDLSGGEERGFSQTLTAPIRTSLLQATRLMIRWTPLTPVFTVMVTGQTPHDADMQTSRGRRTAGVSVSRYSRAFFR
jgi:transposase-like protein